MNTVKQLYSKRLESGEISPDPAQAEAVELLDRIGREIAEHTASTSGPSLFGFRKKPGPPPRGLYIWGAVGRGKSMLMDLFHEAIAAPSKRRVHFHDFMLDTHAFIHEWRQMSSADRRKHSAYVREAGDDPIPPTAKRVADSASILCFDEFHVTSITDAMILGRLFDQLFDRGVTVVATSNRRPGDLYTDGINRQLFLPFIDRLQRELEVLELRSARDYRLERLSAAPVYYSPLDSKTDAAMDSAFRRLTAGMSTEPERLDVQGRRLDVARAASGVARFEFEDLCARPLGAADYLTIARHFHTVLIDHVPRLSANRRNEAARFVTLIDALYESRTKLVMSAAAEPDDLYPSGDGAFEFERTSSRLHEMRSADYLGAERVDVAET